MTTFTSSRVELPFQETSARSLGRSAQDALRLASRSLATVLEWCDVAQQRRSVHSMSDEMLKDIGVSRADAMREAGRRFWDVDATT